ncbi:MAG TPA: NAD-dependent epimerase/dehydratase family protein [Acidimicrobiia bacterium]|nr:NAD-dependent epimerase/dehydratase family protein [Acidimicrobiia bacterium]
MPRAVVLGGTGSIGQAVARRLNPGGWSVELTGRTAGRLPEDLLGAGVGFRQADRSDPHTLRETMRNGADLVVDCACYTAADARSLIPFLSGVEAAVMISTKAVYVDEQGRHVNSASPPFFPVPIPESQPTVAPADGDYRTAAGYAPNKVAAEQVLLDSEAPVTVLRPSKVHGAGALRPREWVFVKRVLDHRPAVFLAHQGESVDHTSAAANIAALVERVAAVPDRRILNSADPDAPSALRIARVVAEHLNHEWREVLLDERNDGLGSHPWETRSPIVLDTSAALKLGYEPVGTFADTIVAEIDWLLSEPERRPAADDPFFAPFLDYEAEDRYLAG